MWHVHIGFDEFILNRYALLCQDTIVVQMSFTIPIKDNHNLSYHWKGIYTAQLTIVLRLSRSPSIDIKIYYELIQAQRLVHNKDNDSNHDADCDSGNAALPQIDITLRPLKTKRQTVKKNKHTESPLPFMLSDLEISVPFLK